MEAALVPKCYSADSACVDLNGGERGIGAATRHLCETAFGVPSPLRSVKPSDRVRLSSLYPQFAAALP